MLKVGAMHLRFMDDEEQYSKFLVNLMYYNEDNDHYTEDVMTALEDGLENYCRYQKLDNALSPRFIRIEKRIFNEEQTDNVNGVSFSQRSFPLLYGAGIKITLYDTFGLTFKASNTSATIGISCDMSYLFL